MPDVQNFYRVSHAIEDFVGITDDKYYPHIGIIRPITAVWMVFDLGYCLKRDGVSLNRFGIPKSVGI
jgi:hypothetical protein